MRSWPALLVAPLVALGQQSASFALVTPACHQQSWLALEAVPAGCLLAILVLLGMAWHDWRRAGAASGRERLVAGAGVGVGALSAAVSLMMWVPVWLLSPCSS
jgi:hypothetical protein